jgi:rubredoxin
MVEIQCRECGEVVRYGIFDGDPECDNCGSTDFEPVSDASESE